MAPFTFKVTIASLTKDNDNHVPFNKVVCNPVVRNGLGATFDNYELTIPKKGTYALSVKLVPSGAHAGYTPVADCEIMVNGVETPLVLDEKKTCARVVLPLDSDQRVWVQYSGDDMNLSTDGVFSVCLLHTDPN